MPAAAAAARAAAAAGAAAAADADGNGGRAEMTTNTTTRRRIAAALGTVLVAGLLATTPAARAQKAFASPQEAANALIDGIARHDPDQVKTVLGADYRRLIPMDDTSAEDRTDFLAAWARGNRIVAQGDDRAMVEIGTRGWTMPIPLVRSAAGWRFDVRAGAEEMRVRRIGRNELAAMQVALAYVDAQREYGMADWDGDGVKSYAMRGVSTPGRRDGLYWASLPGEPESPLGPQFAEAKPNMPYHGYTYRILTAQGKNAPGGAKSYVRNGRMTEGFALIATPAKYNDTGVMTFIVNQDGVVHEKDLGPNTAAVAAGIKTYDPDASWQKAVPPRS
ncbi:MAG: hypothetical protein BroJett026_11930 [Betaproteobacteria bacterium]|nr:MAG: hypothetical protein BroJett026_11930 [Betaproteobacteria bacterium]